MALPNPFRKKKKSIHSFVEPDEIFLDAKNLPKFDTQQFEGRIEKPISKRSINAVRISVTVIVLICIARLLYMQGINGSGYLQKSENNQLARAPIFAERGVIYDRNGVELAWNDTPQNGEPFSRRAYIDAPGFGLLLGYVGYPSKDSSGNYWQTQFIGKAGVEEQYNTLLSGQNGSNIVERDVHGNVTDSNEVYKAVPGSNVTLSIDSGVQAHLAQAIQKIMTESGYQGGGGVIMDISTGEILALTSVPEYSSEVMSDGSDVAKIDGYLSDPNDPFLNRVLGGLYSPGSIVKPYMAMAGLTVGVITPNTLIAAHGTISVPNPYDPAHPTIFRDYRADNGVIDLRHALAYSSNIFFYNVGGGYQSQPGIGIANIDKYLDMFGLDQPTGVDLPNEKNGIIPSPAWKAKNFPGDPWRIGDTYNTAIGQYGVLVTPLEMVRAVASVANGGTLVTPHVLENDPTAEAKKTTLDLSQADFEVVREGMRLVVNDPKGTAPQLNALPFAIAAKTGTAQVGVNNQYLNAWATGFFPYDHPKYAFAIMMEKGTNELLPGAIAVALDEFSWMAQNTPQYTQ